MKILKKLIVFFYLWVIFAFPGLAQESCATTTDLKYYVENNCQARDGYDTPKLVNHLVFDGNQAFCSVPLTDHEGFLMSVNENKVLDFSSASVPFLRNQNYQTKRLNSAENYYSYQASTYHNPDDDILVESGWITKMLPLQVGCITKVTNLLYIHETCEKKGEISCEGLYLDATGEAKVANSDYTIKQLVEEVEEEVEDHIKDRVPFCSKLYTIEEGKKSLAENESAELRMAIENFTYNLPTQYRTGYIVQATRICPVEKSPRCAKPIYEWDYGGTNEGCDWSITPDQIRIFPFKYADIFSNKNFCNQYSDDYPNECEFSDQYTKDEETETQIFQYANPLTEYYDSALLNKQYLEILSRHTEMREATQEARQEMADLAQDTEYDNVEYEDLINCINCEREPLKQALVKIINATAKENKFFEKYLKNNGSDITCGEDVSIRNEITKEIAAPAENPVENPLADSLRYLDWCRLEDRIFFAKAQMKHWVVMPYGSEIDLIEKQILGSFYQVQAYQDFVEADFRQNKRMLINELRTLDGDMIPISILGAAPVTNIFIIQQSLYANKEKLYLILANCENIEAYFLGKCGSGEQKDPDDPNKPSEPIDPGEPVEPGDKDGIIAKICRAFGREHGPMAVAIAKAESNLNPNATNKSNKNGTWDYGLFQINGKAGKPSSDKIYDIDTNIATAVGKHSRYGWCQWDVYRRSGSYNGGCTTDHDKPWYKNYNKNICDEYF